MKTQLVSVIAAGLLIASSVTYAQSEDDTTQQVNNPTVTQNGDTLPDAQGGLSGMGGAALGVGLAAGAAAAAGSSGGSSDGAGGTGTTGSN
ncbi:MAG: hypothetical protein CMK85_09560 [Pseudomonadales bacterium]|uniref:hypothetical protein n=1 Tax=Halopseudomonas aestusnigri TaxID=857252 RepID=UPI000C3D54BD|nr:hypothetical protein [Halopseudomonas aestusnigri]MBP76632.1 hypothetical protein [Pseudomonadales bacterium]MCK5530212.1 hypothetical protein [Halopseudomonas aestusnigri]UGV29350.1 hypothetical protein LO767_09910 [Halopseudomonas aestusnigri]|tara:strand:+ start:17293 stop:17565 length:273 start_codon:yes stop_codon:yes gene_type:complete